jgi:hypothetical protein
MRKTYVSFGLEFKQIGGLHINSACTGIIVDC